MQRNEFCWSILALFLLLGTTLSGSAEELEVNGDEWKVARAEYRQFYSSLPPLTYKRLLVSPDTEPKISRTGGEYSKRREATIWDDGARCAISDRSIFTDFQIAYWLGYDGERFGTFTQNQDFTGVGIKPGTANIQAPAPVNGSIRSEWTLHRLLGRNLHCRTVSLSDVFDQIPKSIAKEELDGKQCIKCRFETIELPTSLPGVTYVVTAWLDVSQGSFPRRIKAEASNGEFTDIRILETTQIVDAHGLKWHLPAVARGTTDHYSIDITFSDITAAVSIPDETFRPPMPFATQVLDQSKGSDEMYYVGGAEGQRECMRLAGIDQTYIKAIVDADPESIREIQSKIPAGQAVPAVGSLQSAETEGWSLRKWLWIGTGLIVIGAIVAKWRMSAS